MPIRTSNRIYVHMPKTGGCWVRGLLRTELSGRRMSGEHTPVHKLRARDIENKMLWGTIRDPWSWYVSWYAHVMQHPARAHLAEYGNGSIEFKDVLKGVLARKKAPKMLGIVWPFHDETWDRKLFLEDQIGLYSWVVRYMYGKKVRTLVDMKQLNAGVQELFGLEIAEKVHPPINRRAYKLSPRDMYNDELVQAVYDADRCLVDGLGYDAPFAQAKKAILQCPQ